MFQNEKGFNLFTALISLMLLSITLVFVYNMVQTEETYLSLIEDQSKTSDLITLGDLARADAFNNFVVSFREQYIYFRSKPENILVIRRSEVMLDWDSFVNLYANTVFFDNQFAELIAGNIANSLTYSNPPLGYGVSVSEYEREDLRDKVKEAFEDADEKIEVVNCDQENNDTCIGTLYFTLDFRDLAPEEYEKLPMVIVSRNVDGEVIQRPIFARREYKIYLPWRGFQAMRSVRNFALGSDLENKDKDDILQGSASSQGFFNPYIHYALNSAKLGVCDIDSCGLRTSLFQTSGEDGFAQKCDNPPNVTLTNISINTSAGNVELESGSHTYNLQNAEPDGGIFKSLIKQTVENNLNDQSFIYAGNDLKTVTTGSFCDNSITNVNYFSVCNYTRQLNSTITKTVNNTITTTTGDSVGNIYPVNLSTSFNEASNLGLYVDSDSNVDIYSDNSTSITQNGGNQHLRCHKLSSINLDFKFEEQDEKYLFVDDEDYKNIYVSLRDGYSNYSFYNSGYNPNIFNNQSEGYFNNNLNILERRPSEWSCNSYEGAPNSPACIPS